MRNLYPQGKAANMRGGSEAKGFLRIEGYHMAELAGQKSQHCQMKFQQFLLHLKKFQSLQSPK